MRAIGSRTILVLASAMPVRFHAALHQFGEGFLLQLG
jgi:hypothetical protein